MIDIVTPSGNQTWDLRHSLLEFEIAPLTTLPPWPVYVTYLWIPESIEFSFLVFSCFFLCCKKKECIAVFSNLLYCTIFFQVYHSQERELQEMRGKLTRFLTKGMPILLPPTSTMTSSQVAATVVGKNLTL